MAVPARLPVDVAAAHRVEPREDVLEDPGLDVVDAGPAVGGGGAFVEDPFLGPLVARQAARDDVALGPVGEDPPLEFGEAHLG